MDKQISENDFVTAFEIGTTYEGLPIRGLKISKQNGNTGIYVDACIHAREWIAPAVATYLIDQLIHSTGLFLADYEFLGFLAFPSNLFPQIQQ